MSSRNAFGLIAAVGALLVAAAAAQAEEPLNLLFFGNSFTNHLNVSDRVKNLATADGHATPVKVFTIIGGDLDNQIDSVATRPLDNITHSALPGGDTYDFVVMQGNSLEATHLRFTDDASETQPFQNDILDLYQAVAHHSSGNGSGVTGVVYQTWARQPTNSIYNSDFANASAMQAEITAGYQTAHDLLNTTEGAGISRIATVGQAFELGGFEGDLYNVDKYHQSEKGATLAALVLYRTIYNEDVGDIAYSQVSSWIDIDSADWDDVTDWADAAPIVISIPEPSSLAMLVFAGLAVLKLRGRRSGSGFRPCPRFRE